MRFVFTVESRSLIIVGMHRSGTSLSANLLQKSGLFIGNSCLEASFDNPKGFYEDEDFLKIHIDILKQNQCIHLLRTNKNFDISIEVENKAKELVAKRNSEKNWGWKDPRTCLFLPFWKKRIPESKFIIIFRPYAEVVDSLHRRAQKLPLRRPLNYVTGEAFDEKWFPLRDYPAKLVLHIGKFFPSTVSLLDKLVLKPMRWIRGSYLNVTLTRLYAKNWYIYNRLSLDFYSAHKEECLCFSLQGFLQHYEEILRYLNSQWEFGLLTQKSNNVFEPNMLQRNKGNLKKGWINKLNTSLDNLYAQLEDAEQESLLRIESQLRATQAL